MLAHQHKLAMRARDHQANQREKRVALLIFPIVRERMLLHFSNLAFGPQPVGINMGFEMVDPNKGEIVGQRKGFANRQTHQKRTGKPRPIGRGYRVDVRQPQLAFSSAVSMTGIMAESCWREATSGTTPP